MGRPFHSRLIVVMSGALGQGGRRLECRRCCSYSVGEYMTEFFSLSATMLFVCIISASWGFSLISEQESEHGVHGAASLVSCFDRGKRRWIVCRLVV